MHKAKWWRKDKEKKIICELCPRNCLIDINNTGYCKVRKNINGTLYSLVYGYPCAINIDPIEKKPLFHFLPGSQVFSIGTIGCNLGCDFCQNHDISKECKLPRSLEYISPQDLVEMATQHESKSIAFTYNEPTIYSEYILDVCKQAKKVGLKTIMVTNGFINKDVIKELYVNIDAANIDLKGFSQDFYKNYCSGNLNNVLENIIEIKKQNTFIELTNLIIPGLNDSEEIINNLVDWIISNLGKDIPLHLSAFYPAYKMLDKIRTPKKTLNKARKIAINKGLNFVFEGNVMTNEYDNTYCPNCNKLLIERQIYTIVYNCLTTSVCSCGQTINIIL